MKKSSIALLVLLLTITITGCSLFSGNEAGLDWDMPVEEQLQIEQENVAKEIVSSFENVKSLSMDEREYSEEMGLVSYRVTINGNSLVNVREGSGQMEQLSLSYHPDDVNLTEIPHAEREDSVSLEGIEVESLTEEDIDNS